MIWKKETDARLTEALVEEHETNVRGRVLRDELMPYEGTPRQLMKMTGQEPLEDDQS